MWTIVEKWVETNIETKPIHLGPLCNPHSFVYLKQVSNRRATKLSWALFFFPFAGLTHVGFISFALLFVGLFYSLSFCGCVFCFEGSFLDDNSYLTLVLLFFFLNCSLVCLCIVLQCARKNPFDLVPTEGLWVGTLSFLLRSSQTGLTLQTCLLCILFQNWLFS